MCFPILNYNEVANVVPCLLVEVVANVKVVVVTNAVLCNVSHGGYKWSGCSAMTKWELGVGGFGNMYVSVVFGVYTRMI